MAELQEEPPIIDVVDVIELEQSKLKIKNKNLLMQITRKWSRQLTILWI